MKVVAFVLCVALSGAFARNYEYVAEIKPLTAEESSKALAQIRAAGTKVADQLRAVPADNGGNYGDLIYRYRERDDTLLVREVIINPAFSLGEQNLIWSVSIAGGRISSVRVLNFGRQRGYCLRIDVAAGDAQVIIRIPPLIYPRIMIEVYGY